MRGGTTIVHRVRAWRAPVLAALAALLLVPAVQAQEAVNRWAPNPPASSYGARFDHLFALITMLIGVSFAIVLVLLVIPVVRDRARPGHKASFDHGSSLHDKRFTAMVSVTVFVVLDAWVLWVAMKDLREGFWNIPRPDVPDVLRVELLAQQWSWNFRTPGSDGKFGTADDIVTINELTVPQDRPVVVNESSKDVIHSFFVPDMRVKRDANPGAINELWFQPVKSGDFQILCAELCGYAHYQMQGKLHVLPQEQYDAWQTEASRIALAAWDENDAEARWAWEFKEEARR
jgi:cytochrome c oxidase subunit 2